MSTVRDQDAAQAEEFWATHQDVGELLERFPEAWDSELSSDMVKLGVYLSLRLQGVAHVWAAMSACRRAPGTSGSDRAFNEHARRRMSRMGELFQSTIVSKARQSGIDTQGKYYVGGLADRRGYQDPGAWVSTVDDIIQVAKERNLTVRGAKCNITHQGHEVPPPKKIPLAPDLVNEMVARKAAQDPSLRDKLKNSPSTQREVREEIIEKHGKA